MVASADQMVKCVVEQQTNQKMIQPSEQRELDVKYRVKDTELYTRVGKTELPISNEVIVREGDDVHFTCRARGNPRPSFKWSYLSLGGQPGLVDLLTNPELSLERIASNQSGSYICVSLNYISNLEYSETRSVRIIVKDKFTFGHQEDPSVKNVDAGVGRYLLIGGVVTGALLFTVFVSLLSVMCVRRCSRKSPDLQTVY